MYEDYKQGFHDVRDSFDMEHQLLGYFFQENHMVFPYVNFTPGYFLNFVRSKIAMSADLGKPQIFPNS